MNLLVLAIFGYVALQMAVGVLVSRNIRTEADYLLAGRKLGPALATFSLFATWFGAETCIGAAGWIYDHTGGYALAWWLCAAFNTAALGLVAIARSPRRVARAGAVVISPTTS